MKCMHTTVAMITNQLRVAIVHPYFCYTCQFLKQYNIILRRRRVQY